MYQRHGLTSNEQIEEMKKQLSSPKQIAKARQKSKLFLVQTLLFSLFFLFLLSILFDVMETKKNGGIPNVLGYHLFRVESGSMEPTLMVGDVILSKKPKDASSLSVGTIVTFYTIDGTIVTHRITDVLTDESGSICYETKGDYSKNSIDSDLLTPDRVIAVFCKIVIHA